MKLNCTQEQADEFKALTGQDIEVELLNAVKVQTKKEQEDLIYRLRKRAEIRRQIPNRKSVQENEPDRIADLLEEAANEIEILQRRISTLVEHSELDVIELDEILNE